MREREAMGRQQTLQNIVYTFVRGFLAACLVMGLAPAVAQGDTTVGVKVDAPVQVNEMVPLSSGSDDEIKSLNGADSAVETQEESSEDTDGERATPEQIGSDKALDSDTAAPRPSQITTDVVLGTLSDTQAETLLAEGLTYLVDREAKTATLTGWYGEAPKGDLSIPAQVTDGKIVFKVENAGGGRF